MKFKSTSPENKIAETATIIKDYICIDPEIQHGQPVFAGTRVPIETLFMHLENGVSPEEFLPDFPSVNREGALGVLGIAEKIMTSKNIQALYETAA